MPFHFDNDMRIFYTGSFWALLNPFAIAAGLVSLGMLIMHGAVYLQIKTEGRINKACKTTVTLFGLITLIVFGLAGIWIANIDGYEITSAIAANTYSNPLAKSVTKASGLWLANYGHYPLLWSIPALAFLTGIVTLLLSRLNRPGLAFITSSFMLASIILTAGVSMFPFLIPSSSDLSSSLTVWDASSSLGTLKIMFWVTLIFLPIVLSYTTWAFRVLRGKVTAEHIHQNDHTAY